MRIVRQPSAWSDSNLLQGINLSKLSSMYLITSYSIPLQFSRMDMLLGFLGYLLSHPSTSLVRAALNESILLHISGKKSWFGDLKLTIDKLCPSYNLPDSSILLGAAESSILGDYKDVISTLR